MVPQSIALQETAKVSPRITSGRSRGAENIAPIQKITYGSVALAIENMMMQPSESAEKSFSLAKTLKSANFAPSSSVLRPRRLDSAIKVVRHYANTPRACSIVEQMEGSSRNKYD